MSRKHEPRRGPAFVEIGSCFYLNLSFDLEPLGEDVRNQVESLVIPDVPADKLLILRELSHSEVRLLQRMRLDCDTETWARIVR